VPASLTTRGSEKTARGVRKGVGRTSRVEKRRVDVEMAVVGYRGVRRRPYKMKGAVWKLGRPRS
jgi:hypothetical protein